jgi:hypothetical protein
MDLASLGTVYGWEILWTEVFLLGMGHLLDSFLSLCLSFFLIAFVRFGLRFGWLYIRAVFF